MTSLRRRRLTFAGAVTIGSLAVLLLPSATPGADVSADPHRDGQLEDVQVTTAPEAEVATEAAPVTTPTLPASTVPAMPSPTVPVARPPLPAPFELAPNEVQREAKRTGAAVVHQLTNYEPDASTADVTASVTVDAAQAHALSAAVAEIHHPGMWSRGTVEYAQLGGHLADRISIMVVVRQDLGSKGALEPERTETRTMDVRLVRNAFGEWEFDRLASAGGRPVARPADLSPLAAWVVDSKRIDLPDTAIWDIYSGHTDPALLLFMAHLAGEARYAVLVLHTGHPRNVFGTDRLSNHTVGLAVDIYEVDSVRVIDAHDVTSSLHGLAEQLVQQTDIREFGSPWLFDGAVASNFTNEVHHDHLHIGVFREAPANG